MARYHLLSFVIKTELSDDQVAELGSLLAADTRKDHLNEGEEFSFIDSSKLHEKSPFGIEIIGDHENSKNIE